MPKRIHGQKFGYCLGLPGM